MTKGRRFNPPLDKDGRWFPHIGLTQKTSESNTRAMLKEPQSPHSPWQVEGKLPPIYKVREKQAVNNQFPFSVHDNRHSLENSGCYLDSERMTATVPQGEPGKRQEFCEPVRTQSFPCPGLRTNAPLLVV
ncbi:PREDICTED: testis-expressed sequence 36 protein isoform X2 [Mandrillus leucophaeus]|uniref:Testis expressed 36 n=1 Tax=Mandrillus leucophaeus TaxID=9568 RepID=A0A2K5XW14_MANLE|nr:PREDICTED: testis-expressed sequence 36 protein isoform X2 [Mandrillus leucophaeus]